MAGDAGANRGTLCAVPNTPIHRSPHRHTPQRIAAVALLALAASWAGRAVYVARPVAGLPAMEFRARVAPRDAVAVQITGDAGWGRLDRHVAERLARQGVAVASLNSLRYFWHARRPEELGRDLDALIGALLDERPGARVLLVGYSMGADALPFAYNRLAPATRAAVAALVVINPAASAVFEFHVSHWWNRIVGPTYATGPEFRTAAASGVPIVCIRGRADPDAVCEALAPYQTRSIDLSGDHDFDGEYHDVAGALLAALAAHASVRPRAPAYGSVGSGSEPSGTPSNSAVDR